MGRRDDVLNGHEFERWYSDWRWAEMMVYLLNLGNRYSKRIGTGDIVLIGDEQRRWYSDWIWAVGVMNRLNLDKKDKDR